MAEVIGLIGGLYTIGNAGLTLYDTLRSFAEGIQTAERDISLVASEIKSTSEVLLLIRESLQESKDSKSGIIKQGRMMIEDLATQCEYCHDLIKELISYLNPYFDESKCSLSKDLVRFAHKHKHVKLLDKWRWQQKIPKVDRLRSYLEALKSNLGLVLPILRYEIAEEKRAPALTRESLKEMIETALHKARSHPPEVVQALAECTEAAKTTSKALISLKVPEGTPEDAIQHLAANIVFADRQSRQYRRHVIDRNDPMHRTWRTEFPAVRSSESRQLNDEYREYPNAIHPHSSESRYDSYDDTPWFRPQRRETPRNTGFGKKVEEEVEEEVEEDDPRFWDDEWRYGMEEDDPRFWDDEWRHGKSDVGKYNKPQGRSK